MVAVPAFFAVTLPLLTEATFELLLFQETVLLLVVFAGTYPTVSVVVLPSVREAEVLFRVILVRGMDFLLFVDAAGFDVVVVGFVVLADVTFTVV